MPAHGSSKYAVWIEADARITGKVFYRDGEDVIALIPKYHGSHSPLGHERLAGRLPVSVRIGDFKRLLEDHFRLLLELRPDYAELGRHERHIRVFEPIFTLSLWEVAVGPSPVHLPIHAALGG